MSRTLGLSAIALLLQLPFAIVLAADSDAGIVAGAVRIGVAVSSPLVFLVLARRPGLRVAVLAGLTLLDILVWAALASAAESSSDFGFVAGHGSGNGPPWSQGFAGPEMTPFYAAYLFAIVAAMLGGQTVPAISAAAGVWLGALLIGPLLGVDWSAGRVASASIGLAIAVGIGAFVRRRRETRRREAAATAARHAEVVQDERLRIARDLHDVLGHSLSQINVQAGVGEHLIDRDPEQARAALAAIRRLSSTGLNEVRALLHTMRSDMTGAEGSEDAPLAPVLGLDDLPALIASLTGGPAIDLDDRRPLETDGTRQRPGEAVGAAAYRIVQEALTNVVRHARAEAAHVEIARTETRLHIRVHDDGTGLGEAQEGTGIIGMRERAKLLHGTVTITSAAETGTATASGTEVAADLPWTTAEPGRTGEDDR